MKTRTLLFCFAALLIQMVAVPVHAQVTAPPAATRPAALAPDIALGRFIALIRGHLLTGDELVARRDWELAARHFNFPTEEIYGVIREDLRRYQVPAFDGALKALVRVVKARNAKQYPAALQSVNKSLDAADTALKARQPNWPRFTVTVAVEVLKAAPDEYDDAIGKVGSVDRIVRPIGYQTARGFILQADRMIENVAGAFTGDNAAPLADMRAGLADLKRAFADVNPPKQPEIDSAAVQAIVSKVETAAAKLS